MFFFLVFKKYYFGLGWNIVLSFVRKIEINKIECDIVEEISDYLVKY